MTTDGGVWTRPQLERFADLDEPEGSMKGALVRVTPRVLLLLMDWVGAEGGRVEVVKASPFDAREVELRFYQRDGSPEAPNEVDHVRSDPA